MVDISVTLWFKKAIQNRIDHHPPPDVYLNASVHVGEIYIDVENFTAKFNLQADVLKLLFFNAGVSASIDRVTLLIQEVNARVLLEARLADIVLMMAIIVNTPVDGFMGTTSTVEARSYNLTHNVLYSIDDYSGKMHTNRILAQNGNIIDQCLDNNGDLHAEKMVVYYITDMRFHGYNQSVTSNSQAERELEYVHQPHAGLSVVIVIFTNAAGTVVGAQVLSESSGGGSSTISAD